MHSFTLTTFFLLLTALLATPILGEYVERRGYDQKFGELEARTPTPARRRGGSSDSDGDDATSTDAASASGTANFAPNNMINLAGAGAAALVAGVAVVF